MLDATQRKGWGGVGHVNVPCTLHTCWMLRNGRVGVGWGMLTFLARCTCWMLRNWRVGVGWGFAERGRSWRKKLTLQLLTIYMILRMLVMMLKMMMLKMMMLWWWWWCDDDDDDGDDDDDVMVWWCDDVMMIMMTMFIMMMTVQTKQVVFWNDDDAFSHAGCAKSLFPYSGVLIFTSWTFLPRPRNDRKPSSFH